MNEQELRQVIREEIKKVKNSVKINEEHEDLKVADEGKALMFKFKKMIDPIFKMVEDAKIINKSKSKIDIYNYGYRLEYDSMLNAKVVYKDKMHKKVMEAISKINDTLYSISHLKFHPASFFQRQLDAGEKTYIEAYNITFKNNDSGRWVKYEVLKKEDIKKAAKEHLDYNTKQIAEAKKLIAAYLHIFLNPPAEK